MQDLNGRQITFAAPGEEPQIWTLTKLADGEGMCGQCGCDAEEKAGIPFYSNASPGHQPVVTCGDCVLDDPDVTLLGG